MLLDNPSFVAELKRWADPEKRDAATGEALRADMLALLEANAFDGISVVDSQARLLINLPDDIQAREQCRQSASQTDVAAGAGPQVSFAFDGATGRPKVDVIGTVLQGEGSRQHPLATLCMRVDLGQRLLPVVSHWPGVAHSGEVLIGRANGADIIWLNDRPKPEAAWHMTRLVGARSGSGSTVRETQAGQLRNVVAADGRRQLLSAYEAVGSPWLLLIRMDAEESDQLQSRNQMRGAVALGFLLIFVVGALAVAWARSSYGRSSVHAQRDALLLQLRDMAYFDELTGMPGRRLIQDRLDMALKDAERRREHVGLMFIDLDKFNAVNDRHGHAAGDFLLKVVAERLHAVMRRNDSAGRLAGDEFLVILPGNADAATMDMLRSKVAAPLTEPIQWQASRWRLA